MINKDRMAKVVLTAVVLLLVAGLSEIAMRFYYQSKHSEAEAVCLQGDDKLIYKLKANSKPCGTNTRGFRGREYPLKKTGKRIVIIGDSVANGLGVPWDKSFAQLLEDKLNTVSDTLFEVIVLAVPGYSTSQEINLLKDDAFLYDPDLIVFAYHLNDPAHPLFHNAGGQVGMHFIKPASYAYFYLQRLVFRAKAGLRGLQRGCPKNPWCLFLHCVYWPQVQHSFAEIMDIAKQKNTHVVFAFLPLLFDPDERNGVDALYGKLADLAGENGAQSVNLQQIFDENDMESVRVPGDPWHPNELGHQMIADRLFNFFQENTTLLPKTDLVKNIVPFAFKCRYINKMAKNWPITGTFGGQCPPKTTGC